MQHAGRAPPRASPFYIHVKGNYIFITSSGKQFCGRSTADRSIYALLARVQHRTLSIFQRTGLVKLSVLRFPPTLSFATFIQHRNKIGFYCTSTVYTCFSELHLPWAFFHPFLHALTLQTDKCDQFHDATIVTRECWDFLRKTENGSSFHLTFRRSKNNYFLQLLGIFRAPLCV